MNTRKRKEPLPDPKTTSTNNKKTKLSVSNNDDGNCLYRSILYCLLRDDISYNDFRHYVCDHIEERGLHYSLFIGNNFTRYFATMRKNRCGRVYRVVVGSV